MSFLRRKRPRPVKTYNLGPDVPVAVNLGDDPLDPHGDGTIRKGDPMFDLLMSGDVIYARRRPDGTWDVDQ